MKFTRIKKPAFAITEGATYRYISGKPSKCTGHLYRVLKCHVLDVPDYQYKVLVQALTGPDEGMWFTCTPDNFSTRYEAAPEAEQIETRWGRV